MITRSKTKKISNMPLNRTPLVPTFSGVNPQNNDETSLLDLDVDNLNKTIGLDVPSFSEDIPHNLQNVTYSDELDAKISRVATAAVSSALTDMMQNLTLTLTNKFETMFRQNQVVNHLPARTSSPSHESKILNNRQHYHVEHNQQHKPNKTNFSSIDRSKVASNIARWNIKFDGHSMSINQFIFRISKLQQSYGYSEEQLFDNFHLLVEGQAQSWYWNYSTTHPFSNYEELIKALVHNYDSTESIFELARKVDNVKQRESDSFESFYNEILRRNALLPKSKIKSDYELMDIIRHNVKPSIRQIIYYPAKQTRTLNELVTMCRDAESQIKSYNSSFTNQKHKVHEIQSDNNLVNDNSIDAFNKISQRRQEYQCTNCSTEKHPRRDTLHCFKCGLDNTISSECPRCKSNQN